MSHICNLLISGFPARSAGGGVVKKQFAQASVLKRSAKSIVLITGAKF
ncbi:hypothetical protein [Oculatella sp. LEGE 06141]